LIQLSPNALLVMHAQLSAESFSAGF